MIVWRKSRGVVLAVVRCSEKAWRPWFAAVFAQAQRASLSVQLNIAEGYALWHPKQRRRHLRIAYGSAVESVDLLELLKELEAIPTQQADLLIREGREVCRMLVRWLKRTEESDTR
jgi:four helix bundle protein